MPKETEKLFKTMLKQLRPLFTENGFRALGQNFALESTECWVIVNFQKSRWANEDETTFYVNVAACSKRWLGVYGAPPDGMPSYAACDWRRRAEELAPDKSVSQWTLRDQTSLESVQAYLHKLFRDYVLPATRTMTTEADLLKHTGGFAYLQLKTRSVIFAATNQTSDLKETVAKLIETVGSSAVAVATRDHLTMLRLKYPQAMKSVERG